MQFGSTFSRMAVGPGTIPSRLETVERLQKGAIRPLTHESEADSSSGWATFAHPLDTRFDEEKANFNEYVAFAYRTDAFRLPTGTLKLRQREAELQWMAENRRDTIPKSLRKSLHEQVRAELRAATTPSIKSVPIVWDRGRRLVFAWTHSVGALDDIRVLFSETFGLDLMVKTPAMLAEQVASESEEAAAFSGLGPEFLAWLWWSSERPGGLKAGDSMAYLTDQLQLDGGTMKSSYKADCPTDVAEARLGVRSGRCLMGAGLLVGDGERTFRCTVRAADLALSKAKLPALLAHEEAEGFYETMWLVEQLDAYVDGLFLQFLGSRLGVSWGQTQEEMRRWAVSASEAAHTELYRAELSGLAEQGIELINASNTDNVVQMRRPHTDADEVV